MSRPKVSVVMAVHNGQEHLPAALDSLWQQSLADFELLVVDDGSTDDTARILADCTDSRLRVLTHPAQQGLAASLNAGLQQAVGDYVARMDHDDVCLPRRLELQARFLDKHPDIDILGSWARTLGLEKEQVWAYPTEDADIRSELIFNPVLVHSSVMLRRSRFGRDGWQYDQRLARAQDYDLWVRAAAELRFANLDEVLLLYRLHPNQVGQQFGHEQQEIAQKIRVNLLQRLGLSPNQAEIELHHAISHWQYPQGRAGLEQLEDWFLTLRSANRASGVFPAAAFDGALERRWWAACRANAFLGIEAWRRYMDFGRVLGSPRSLVDKGTFGLKTILRQLRGRPA